MPEVNCEIEIDAPVEKVYELAKDIEHLPSFLPNVEKVTIIHRNGLQVKSQWIGRVPEFNRKLSWTEEDIWDDVNRRCTFRALEGDWDRYEGVWSFVPNEGSTHVNLSITYEYNVPLIGAIIRSLLHRLVERSAEETLLGLRAMAKEAD